MKGDSHNFEAIVEETKDYMNSKGYQFWKEQEAHKKKRSSINEEWLVGYGACLAEVTKAFKEIIEKHKTVEDGD